MFTTFRAVFLLLIAIDVAGQNAHIDSLYRQEQTIDDAIARVKLIHRIVSASWDYDLEKAYSEAQRGYALAKETNDPECQMILLTDLGMYHYFTGSYSEASRYYQRALRSAGGKNFGDYPAYTF